ncbi:MAG: hypothetical protein K8F91_24855, partial [Candidatus Obscuribacterales bacterium]|nr:hypothetical protein [Candidatus Obscuribacterales bacterium]
MNSDIAQFLGNAVQRAVLAVEGHQCLTTKLCVERQGSVEQVWLVTELVGKSENPELLPELIRCHSNDADFFAGTRGYSFVAQDKSAEALIDKAVAYLIAEFTMAESIKVKVLFFAAPG